MLSGRAPRWLALLLGPIALAACFPELPSLQERETDGSGEPVPTDPGPRGDDGYDLPDADPHALLGVDPPHGPFSGGQRRIVRGYGFSSEVRVFFGESEVPKVDILPIDPGRVQVLVPPGVAGEVDVRTQNGVDTSTARTLQGGYVYDAFYTEPSSGPTSGGTVVTFHGQGTSFDASTKITIGGKACEEVQVESETRLRCVTSANTPGKKSATVTQGGASTTVLDAFTYADSDNGFRGGFSGDALSSSLRVLAFNSFTGAPIGGATVIAGDDLAAAHVAQTDAKGVALVQGEALGPKRSITVAAKCHHPQSFVDVPVDTVTVYLAPVLSPACIPDDPAIVGGRPSYAAKIRGEIVWPMVGEFKRGAWSNVPQPMGDEERVAYLFTASQAAGDDFRLPDPPMAVRPEAEGQQGFRFDLSAPPGNLALYALAGLERPSPRKFTAYAMGAIQGISASPGGSVSDVFVEMNITLDQALRARFATPAPGSRGPDRLRATVAVTLGNHGYALLPGMQKTSPLPFSGELGFIGLPALRDSLSASRYVVTARAATGPALTFPLTVSPSLATNDASQPLLLNDFVSVPSLTSPEANAIWDGQRLSITFTEGGIPADLVVYDIRLGGGLMTWTVATPGSVREVTLPNLVALSHDLGIPPGPVTIRVSAARIDGFDYGQLMSKHLSRGGWNGYAIDESAAHL